MARPQTHQPKVIEYLQAHPDGVTRKDIADHVGCSPQMVHRITTRGDLDPDDPDYLPIKVVGQGKFAADLLAWDGPVPRPGSAIVTTASPRNIRKVDSIPGLGEKLTVVGMSMVDGHVEVVVESDSGEQHTFTR